MPTTNPITRSNWIALIAAVLLLGTAVVVAKTWREPLSDPQFAVKAAPVENAKQKVRLRRGPQLLDLLQCLPEFALQPANDGLVPVGRR